MKKTNHIVCRKFGAKPKLNWNNNKRNISLFIRENTNKTFNGYKLASTDGKSIVLDGEKKTITPELLISISKSKDKYIVLTAKEYSILVELELELYNKVSIFEKEFPVFNDIRYFSSPMYAYDFLEKKFKKLKSMGFCSKNIINEVAFSHKKKCFKKIKRKLNLDSHFYSLIQDGYKEVFKLKECDKKRMVVALDYNSMYASCMEGFFLNPSKLNYLSFDNTNADPFSMPTGVFRVILGKPNNLNFNKFHPFKYRASSLSLNFRIQDNDIIDIVLHDFELKYYANFFDNIKIIEGLVSDDYITHPLYNRAKKIYKQRLGFKKNSDKSNALLAKLKLVTMHSTTNPLLIKKRIFNDFSHVKIFLENKYNFTFEKELSVRDHFHKINMINNFKIVFKKNKFFLNYPDCDNNESVFCLSSAIIAKSQLKMTKFIMNLLEHNSVEICYANIDSIHFSVDKDKSDKLMTSISNSISGDMGDLKIQAIADEGFWFDVGRYWLIKNENVILHRNIFFNQIGCDFFSDSRLMYKISKTKSFNYLHKFKVSIFNSFSYRKKLIKSNSVFERYTFDDIDNTRRLYDTLLKEVTNSKSEKISLFKKIKNLYSTSTGK